MMDLGGKTILIKHLKACSWKSLHELPYNYLVHTTSFHVILCVHIFFMNDTYLHITTNSPHYPHFRKENTQNKIPFFPSFP